MGSLDQMGIHDYEDKRDENGALLRYSAHAIATDVAAACYERIKVYTIYEMLSGSLNPEYIQMYFKKYFYEEFLPLAHQIVLHRWYLKNVPTCDVESIKVMSFPCVELLKEIWPDRSIPWEVINKNQDSIGLTMTNKRELRQIYYRIISLLASLRKSHSSVDACAHNREQPHQPVIAVNYAEGIDLNKRSDLFWYQGSGVEASSILIYFESDTVLDRYAKAEDVIDNVEQLGFKWVTLFKQRGFDDDQSWANEETTYSTSLRKLWRMCRVAPSADNIEQWLKKEVDGILSRVDYWYRFFKTHNVKIHHDPTESGLLNIVKNLALHLVGGCSIGKVRSYPPIAKGMFYCYYPNDVFFVYGEDSVERFMNTENARTNVIISGYPYGSPNAKVRNNVHEIRRAIERAGARFFVLLLDNIHSSNEGIFQVIYTPALRRFYEQFLEWLLEDTEVGIIIKSKKPVVLEKLPEITPIIDRAEITGRCHSVQDMFGAKPADYAKIADMVVSIGAFIPSSLIDCVVAGARGIFYDYPNLSSIETGLYDWGNRRVVFTNLDEIIINLKSYKKNCQKNTALGDWSEHLYRLDPFRDNRGGKRIGTYIRWLQEGFEKGLDRVGTISRANGLYAKAWGEDKVYLTLKVSRDQ